MVKFLTGENRSTRTKISDYICKDNDRFERKEFQESLPNTMPRPVASKKAGGFYFGFQPFFIRNLYLILNVPSIVARTFKVFASIGVSASSIVAPRAFDL